MIKPFLLLVTLLIVSVSTVLAHYLSYDHRVSQKRLQTISTLTDISSASLSVAYYEPKILFYDEASNPAYPQMQSINKMDFVYAK